MVPPAITSLGASKSPGASNGEFIRIGKLICLPKQAPVVIQKVNNMNPKRKEVENVPPVEGEGHKAAGTKQIMCDECGKFFKNNTNLKMHEARHKGVKDFACTSCDRRFINPYLLKVHVRVRHLGETPYACQFCDRKFFTSAARNNHQRTQHIRALSFECELCSALFNTKTDLNRHKYRHTGQTPFRCEVCSVSFPRRSNLIKHYGSQGHKKKAASVVDYQQSLL